MPDRPEISNNEQQSKPYPIDGTLAEKVAFISGLDEQTLDRLGGFAPAVEPERPTCCPGHADPYASGRCEPHKTTTSTRAPLYGDTECPHRGGWCGDCFDCGVERERARIERGIQRLVPVHMYGDMAQYLDRRQVLNIVIGDNDAQA